MARRRLTPAQPGYLSPAARQPLAAPPPIAKVSGQSAEAAALRELSEGIEAARAEGRLIVEVPLTEIATGHLLRDRISLDREALDALKASLREHGQRIPAELTPLEQVEGAHRFGLIAGWRRVRALTELFDETKEARFSTVRALIRPAEEAARSYVAMVEENEIRVGLSYYERARVVAETTRRGVFVDQSAALRSLFATASRAKRSKIGSFVTLYEDLDDVLRFPAEIPERLGLALVARLRLDGRGKIRRDLSAEDPKDAAAELACLERLSKPEKPDVSRAKQSVAAEGLAPGLTLKSACKGQKITLTLSGEKVDAALLERVVALLRKDLS